MGNTCAGQEKKAKLDLSPEEFDEAAMKDAYQVCDRNGDGVIQKNEIEVVLEKYHNKKPTPTQLGKIMAQVDLDADGVVNFEEFTKMMKERIGIKNSVKSSFEKAFESGDINKDGFISKGELSKVLNDTEATSDEEIDEIFACADLDGDGKINIEEFLNFFV